MQNKEYEERFLGTKEMMDTWLRICNSSQELAVFAPEESFRAVAKKICPLMEIPEPVSESSTSLGIGPKFKERRSFDIG